MNGLQSLEQWKEYFNYPTGSALGLLNAVQVCPPLILQASLRLSDMALKSLGGLLAFPISPYIADGLGRRIAILIGSFICCVGTALQTTANSVTMFMIARCRSLVLAIQWKKER